MKTMMKIEWPVLNLVLSSGLFYANNWQPDQHYWNGRNVEVPEPFQGGPILPFMHHPQYAGSGLGWAVGEERRGNAFSLHPGVCERLR